MIFYKITTLFLSKCAIFDCQLSLQKIRYLNFIFSTSLKVRKTNLYRGKLKFFMLVNSKIKPFYLFQNINDNIIEIFTMIYAYTRTKAVPNQNLSLSKQIYSIDVYTDNHLPPFFNDLFGFYQIVFCSLAVLIYLKLLVDFQ